jgi:hypothetical protein
MSRRSTKIALFTVLVLVGGWLFAPRYIPGMNFIWREWSEPDLAGRAKILVIVPIVALFVAIKLLKSGP